MKLILEGPDNGGKTSLATRLRSCTSAHYFMAGSPPVNHIEELKCMHEQYDLLSGPDTSSIIVDRLTSFSQPIYNPDSEHDENRRFFRQAIIDLKPIIVYCRPSTDKLLRVQDLTWRDGETEEHKQKIIRNQHIFVERYDKMFAGIPCVTYDYENDGNRELIFGKLRKALSGSSDDEQWFHSLINYRST